MNIFISMIRKELLEIYRSKKFLILVILFLFIAISSPILAKLLPVILKSVPATPGITIDIPDPTWKDAVDQLVKNLSQIGMIVLIIMFAGSIADEKNKKTLEMVLTKPVSRPKFVLAKFVASLLATMVVFIIAMAVFYFYTVSILGTFSVVNFLWLSVFSMLFLVFIISLTLFFSAISKSQIVALALTFGTEAVIAIVFGSVKKIADYSPSYIFDHYAGLMANGITRDFWPTTIVSIGTIILLVIFSIHFFSRQEIEC